MAEALASSFLGKIGDVLLEKIGCFVVAPIGRQFTYVCCFNSNIKELETQLEELQRTRQGVQRSVDDDKLNVRDIDPNVEAWMEKANKVLTEVVGIIQEYPKVEETTSLLAEGRLCTSTLPQIPQEPRAPDLPFSNPEVKEGCFNGWWSNLKLRYSLSRKVVKKTKAILELKVDGIAFCKSSHRPTPTCLETILNQDFEGFESRKDQMEEVMEALKHDKFNLIGISGLPGLGKTKMVKEVGRRMKEEELFDEVGFVSVGQDLDLTNVQNCIAENFGLLDLKKHDHAITRANLLRKRLSQDKKRILLILDDIWEKFDLKEQGIPLESANGTFKVLYTSRKGGLWDEVHTKTEITLERLSEEEAWQLFRARAGRLADAPKLKSTAKKIVNKCGSLPLALVIFGGLLSDKRSKTSGIDGWEENEKLDRSIIDRWEEMLDRLTHITITPADDGLFSRLELSYNYLKEEAKELFLLCCLFEEDKSIGVEDLAKYALGLSLFDALDEMSEVRRRVATLVGDLKSCYLLLDGDYGRESVKVHDVVRDMGICIASKYKGALVSHGVASDWPKKDTYENYTTISMISEKITKLPEGLKCRDLKFLLLQCRKLKKLPGNFFEGMDKLKVLELRDFDGNLGLQYLRNLTMLSLEGFGGKLENIVVIADLENLEILSFRGSWIKELPEEVGKLLKLRLLDLITKAPIRIPPNVISRLECLEELYIRGDNYVDPREFGPNLQILQIDECSVLAKAQDDAVDLNRAFAGWGCDQATILKILARRSMIRRALIRQEYKTKYSEDFDHRLSKELMFSPDLKRALLLWMDDPASRDAKLVKHGLKRNLNAAIEVICSRTPSQLEELKKAYRSMFTTYLDEDIESHAPDDNKKLLVAYAGAIRSESPELDAVMVDKDATDLFKDGEWRYGTNEETFIRIFSERSSAHLVAINSAYRKMYVNSLKKAVKKETSSKFKRALLTILQCAENPGKYFAKALHKAMAGLGTDDETLTRIIVSRAEVDIEKIKAEYVKKYGKPLSDDVHEDTSGQYRAFLLSLLNPIA